MSVDPEILTRLPHRPPFLWIDRIIEQSSETLVAEKHFPPDLDIFTGHYPGNPIVPGVILCEALFQTGALLMSYLTEDGKLTASVSATPVITRIGSAKFKRMVRPGETVQLKAQLTEIISGVALFKGIAKIDGKTSVQIEFNCTFID